MIKHIVTYWGEDEDTSATCLFFSLSNQNNEIEKDSKEVLKEFLISLKNTYSKNLVYFLSHLCKQCDKNYTVSQPRFKFCPECGNKLTKIEFDNEDFSVWVSNLKDCKENSIDRTYEDTWEISDHDDVIAALSANPSEEEIMIIYSIEEIARHINNLDEIKLEVSKNNNVHIIGFRSYNF